MLKAKIETSGFKNCVGSGRITFKMRSPKVRLKKKKGEYFENKNGTRKMKDVVTATLIPIMNLWKPKFLSNNNAVKRTGTTAVCFVSKAKLIKIHDRVGLLESSVKIIIRKRNVKKESSWPHIDESSKTPGFKT